MIYLGLFAKYHNCVGSLFNCTLLIPRYTPYENTITNLTDVSIVYSTAVLIIWCP